MVGTLGMRVKYEISVMHVASRRYEYAEPDECTIEDGDFFGVHHFFGYEVYDNARVWGSFVDAAGLIRFRCKVHECE